MGSRFRTYRKVRVGGRILLASDATFAEQMALTKDDDEDKVFAYIMDHTWAIPDADESRLMDGEISEDDYLAQPLPYGFQAARPEFNSVAEMKGELSGNSLQVLAEVVAFLSNADSATFRGGGRKEPGPDPGPNGAEVGDEAVLDPVRTE